MANRVNAVHHNESRTGKASKMSKAAQAAQGATNNGQPDWGRIEPQLIWQVIQACTRDDGAVLFGYSRDGGAYAVKVYEGGEQAKFYGNSDEEVTGFLIRMLELYNG